MTKRKEKGTDLNNFFRKRNIQDQAQHILKILSTFDQKARVEECITKQKAALKKQHPDWSERVITKKAQVACGQKATVPADEKKKNTMDESMDECVSRKISIFSDEHPDWKHDRVVAAAHGWCRENRKKKKDHFSTDSYLQGYSFLQKNVDKSLKFYEYTSLLGFNAAVEDKATCYKMKNLKETDTEYIVPVVIAKAMVQPYPSKKMVMAKLPSELEKARTVDYETGVLTNKLPTFELHPEEETRKNENGYVTDIRYQSDKERIVGLLHVIKDKLSDNLRGYFDRGEQIHVSIGFMYIEGPGGTFKGGEDNQWNGQKYDAAQLNLLLTHLALLPPNKSRGRCPLPYCGVGININDSIKISDTYLNVDLLRSNYDEIRDIDGVIDLDTDGDIYIRTSSDVINLTRTIREQSREIQDLKRMLRKYFVLMAQALNR